MLRRVFRCKRFIECKGKKEREREIKKKKKKKIYDNTYCEKSNTYIYNVSYIIPIFKLVCNYD